MLDQSQISYLKNVLGIEGLIWPETVAVKEPQPVKIAPSARLLALVAGPGFDPSGEQGQLLEKMITAMRLAITDVEILVVSLSSGLVATRVREFLDAGRLVICFGKETLAQEGSVERFEVGRGSFHITHALADLVAQPGLKRETWAHLQDVMKRLN